MIPNWTRGVSLFSLLLATQGIAQAQDISASIAAAQAQGVSPEILQQLANKNASANGNLAAGFNRTGPANSPLPGRDASGVASIPGYSPNLAPFGQQLFATNGNKYITPSDLPVPADYIIGIGDTVEIRYFGKENRVMRLLVERDGNITIPEIGAVSVSGLSLQNMGSMLLERIAKQKIGVEATVSMGPLRSIQIFLMGDVNYPGAVTTDALTTVSNALLYAGGLKPSGSMRRIEIRRQGKVISRIDLYNSLLKGSDTGEIRLQSGDVIFIPSVGKRAAVDGEVLRPAIYELLHEKTIGDLIKLAGGLKPTAYPEQSRLNRVGKDWQRSTSRISLAKASDQSLGLNDGDILEIPGVIQTQTPSEQDFRFKTVSLEGQFLAGGTYAWRENLKLGELIPRYEQLNLATYRPLAVIDRVDPLTGSRYYKTVNLLHVVGNKQAVPLERDDRIITFSQKDIEFLSSVAVQQVLSGHLPINNADSTGVIVDTEQGKSNKKQNIEAKNREIFDAGDNTANSRSELIASTPLATNNSCLSLAELAHIISNEGSDRFRSAVFAGAYAEEGKQFAKSMACPAIFEQNPRLLPFLLENAVTMRGEVKDPGVIPIPEGLTLDIALRSRGGLTRSADPKGIEINKLVPDDQQMRVVRERVADSAALDKITLEPGYIVQIRKRATEQDSGLVRLSGELAHPGAYEIRKGEKLSELLARAGGLSPFAYPIGTVFMRPRIKEEKRQYYAKAANDITQNALFSLTREKVDSTGNKDTAAILQIAQQIRNTNPVGRMVIEADPTLLQVRPELDVMLEPGDEIFIPRRPNTILVMGEVLNPGAVQFVAGKKANEYIRDAGGLGEFADEKRIIAVYPNGQAEPIKISSWNFSPTLLPPGSAIYVSREAITTTSIDVIKLTLQMVKDLALAAASLYVIGK